MSTSLAGFPIQSKFDAPVGSEDWASEIVEVARQAGHCLRTADADTGQTVWSWSRSDGSGPVFLTRRAALNWMADQLEDSRR